MEGGREVMERGREVMERGREVMERGREVMERGREVTERGREVMERGREVMEREEESAPFQYSTGEGGRRSQTYLISEFNAASLCFLELPPQPGHLPLRALHLLLHLLVVKLLLGQKLLQPGETIRQVREVWLDMHHGFEWPRSHCVWHQRQQSAWLQPTHYTARAPYWYRGYHRNRVSLHNPYCTRACGQ